MRAYKSGKIYKVAGAPPFPPPPRAALVDETILSTNVARVYKLKNK